MKIKTFGPVDQRSLEQLERCMHAGDAEYGVLCADHHPGYSQPIGGAIAYEGYVSPSGVGFDVGCVAAGEAVLTDEGYTHPIEEVAQPPVCADAAGRVRRVDPFLGVVSRGHRATQRLTLSNGRSLKLTGDHEVRTDHGWVRADTLVVGDLVLCPAYVGLRYEPCQVIPALTRIAGYVDGDGHLAARCNRVVLYTSKSADAIDLARDLLALGLTPAIHRRRRTHGGVEHAVYVTDATLHDMLAALGCPVGKKAARWTGPDWLLTLPAWARASYLSAFASAEMATPRLVEHRIANLAMKQRGRDAIERVGFLLESLGFEVGISKSDGDNWVAQILGGEAAQARFIEQVGFNRAAEKRAASARCLAVAWERAVHLNVRNRARAEVRDRMARGEHVRSAVAKTAAQTGLSEPTVLHLAYRHAPLRRARGWCPTSSALGDCAYSAVTEVCPEGYSETFDVVTADAAEAFVASGIAVHNCGNKAVRTDLTRTEMDKLGGVERVMRQVTRRISFGMGVPARERVDHPILEKIRTAEFTPQRRLAALAESQLGTVGSGNHYVT